MSLPVMLAFYLAAYLKNLAASKGKRNESLQGSIIGLRSKKVINYYRILSC
jgi:hypothetical protein